METAIKKDYAGIARAIAAAMQWRDTTKEERANDQWRTLEDDHGRKLHLHFDSYASKNRIRVSGGWPSYKRPDGSTQQTSPRDLWNPQEGSPEITVSMEKSPDKIASDILRRLMPDYVRIHARLKAHADEQGDHARKTLEAAQALVKDFGGTAKAEGSSVRVWIPGVSVSMSGPDSVRFEYFNVEPKAAREIIAILKRSEE